MTPTRWYLWADLAITTGTPMAAARSYWPGSSLCEVFTRRDRAWLPRPILRDLADDTCWVEVTEQAVTDWLTHTPR